MGCAFSLTLRGLSCVHILSASSRVDQEGWPGGGLPYFPKPPSTPHSLTRRVPGHGFRQTECLMEGDSGPAPVLGPKPHPHLPCACSSYPAWWVRNPFRGCLMPVPTSRPVSLWLPLQPPSRSLPPSVPLFPTVPLLCVSLCSSFSPLISHSVPSFPPSLFFLFFFCLFLHFLIFVFLSFSFFILFVCFFCFLSFPCLPSSALSSGRLLSFLQQPVGQWWLPSGHPHSRAPSRLCRVTSHFLGANRPRGGAPS